MLTYYEAGGRTLVQYQDVVYEIQQNVADNPYVLSIASVSEDWKREHKANALQLLVLYGISKNALSQYTVDVIQAIKVYEKRRAWFGPPKT